MASDDFKNLFILKTLGEKKENNFLIFFLKNKWKFLIIILTILIFVFIFNIYFTKINLNSYNTKQNLFQVNNGESIAYISQRLENDKVISSALAFKIYVKLFSNKEIAQAGIYKLEKQDTLISLARKILKGKYAIPPVKITIPEGSDSHKIAGIISKAFLSLENESILLDDFSEENIYSKIESKIGYLFPETYLFLPNVYLDEVITQMEEHFYFRLYSFLEEEKNELNIYSLDMKEFNLEDYFNSEEKEIDITKRLTIISEIGTTTVSLKDIITMASYLEGEANNEQDMKLVSGALWARYRINYPLQIDAATSTYREKGFTKTPINNPGLIAIRAAITPINKGYIYYITGNDGQNYYAEDYDKHLDNIERYLRN